MVNEIETPSEHDLIAMLRDVSQGYGITDEAVTEWLKEHQYYNVDAADLYQRVLRASELVTNPEHRQAIRNALAIEGSGRTLTERRTNLLTTVDVTYRTLVRHETEGAAAIAQLLPKVTASGLDEIGLLHERLDDIEALMLVMAGKLLNESKYVRLSNDNHLQHSEPPPPIDPSRPFDNLFVDWKTSNDSDDRVRESIGRMLKRYREQP